MYGSPPTLRARPFPAPAGGAKLRAQKMSIGRWAVQAIAEKYEIAAPIIGTTIEKGIEIRQRNLTLGAWEIAALNLRKC